MTRDDEIYESVLKDVAQTMNLVAEPKTEDSVAHEHVLIVDDENGPRQALRMLLKEEHIVHIANDVEQAIEMVEDEPITLVITDLRMPKYTGVDLLCKVKEQYPDIQVIILTGYGQLDSAMKAVEFGAFAYMEKPFDNFDMLEHVKAGIERYHQEHERRILEDLALEANRFETIGRVVAGMVHDLGTPLSVLNGELELLKLKKEVSDLPRRLDTMQSQVQHCTDMVRTTMGLLRNESQGTQHFSLNSVLESCLSVCESTLRQAHVTVDHSFSSRLPACMGDTVMVRQAILNLINNACHAMSSQDSDRMITVKTWFEDNHVCLSVTDTGPGITEKDRLRIFDTFYTTKGKDGAGLGLAVVKNVMRRHCGTVFLANNPEMGASFILKFPVPNEN